MADYTVKQVAEILGTKEDTVRKWIRDKKLAATQTSRKTGNVISEAALSAFLVSMPKYAQSAASYFGKSASPANAIAASAIAAALGITTVAAMELVGRNADEKTSTISEDSLRKFLQEKISSCEESINLDNVQVQHHERMIKLINRKIEEKQNEIAGYQKILDSLASAKADKSESGSN